MEHTTQKDLIGTMAKPVCHTCGSYGKILHRDCEDRLFGAPGSWTFRRCPNLGCGLNWLDPMPRKDEIDKAYLNYYTHKKIDASVPRKRNNIFMQNS
jgi:hypothetical protein